MSFFKKLKSKLFKSSSKLEEGLDAIVEDGGVEEEVAEAAVSETTAEAEEAARIAADAATAAQEKAAEDAAMAAALEVQQTAEKEAAEKAAQKAAELAKQQAAKKAAAEQAAKEKAAEEIAAAREAAKAKAEAAAEQTAKAEAAEKEAAKAEQEKRDAEKKAAQEAQQAAEAAKAEAAQEEARKAAEAAKVQQEEKRKAQEAAKVQQEEKRIAQEAAEAAKRIADEAAAEEQRKAEEVAAQAERKAAEAAKPGLIGRMLGRKTTPEPVSEPQPEPAPEPALKGNLEVAKALVEDTTEEPAKAGLMDRVLGREAPKKVIKRTLDDAMLESLEELLITADMGVETALRVTANIAEGRFGKKLSVAEIKALLSHEVTRIMEPVAKPMPLYPKKPQVVLVVGVNGSGKTTTIGKLALQFKQAGKSVVIAAGDTFRAAAVEQLQVWGERAGVPVLTAPEGSDPASLAYDAMERAERDGADLLMIDTAGRLQNRQDLMEELAKIVRVIRKKDDSAPHNTLLVLDATTGQNAVNQVDVFQKISDVSGLVMTKLDGTAKGGVLVSLADKFGLPIHAIGIGEQIDDLQAFDPEDFARALTGYDG